MSWPSQPGYRPYEITPTNHAGIIVIRAYTRAVVNGPFWLDDATLTVATVSPSSRVASGKQTESGL
jgi:hypothetical protein